ncbi:MAG: hypothetical protein ACOVQ2_01805 [Flavobacterium sp.]
MILTKKLIKFGLSFFEIVETKFYKKILNIITHFFIDLIFLIAISLFTLFMAIGLSILIGNYLNCNYLGFIIIGLLFGLTTLGIAYFSKNKLQYYLKLKIYKYLKE